MVCVSVAVGGWGACVGMTREWNFLTFDEGISRKMSSRGNPLTAVLVVRAYIKGIYFMGALVCVSFSVLALTSNFIKKTREVSQL